MKILIVTESFLPKVNGVTFAVKNLYEQFKNLGHEVKLILPRFKDMDLESYDYYQMKTWNNFWGSKYPYLLPRGDKKLRKFVEDFKPDIINLQCTITSSWWFHKYAKKHNIPLVYAIHSQFRYDFKKFSGLLAFAPCARLANSIAKSQHLVCVSKNFDNPLIRKNMCIKKSVKKEDVLYIPNGTDFVNLNKSLVNQITNKYKVSGTNFNIIFCGRTEKYKNLDIVISSLAKLKEANFNNLKFNFIVIGDGEYLNNLKSLASTLGVEQFVTFTGMILNRTEIMCLYSVSNLNVVINTFDTSSLSKFDAACYNIPTIFLKDSCNSFDITDGYNGYLLNSVDSKELANKIISSFKNNELVGKQAHLDFYMSWNHVAKIYLDLFNKVIKEQ